MSQHWCTTSKPAWCKHTPAFPGRKYASANHALSAGHSESASTSSPSPLITGEWVPSRNNDVKKLLALELHYGVKLSPKGANKTHTAEGTLQSSKLKNKSAAVATVGRF